MLLNSSYQDDKRDILDKGIHSWSKSATELMVLKYS